MPVVKINNFDVDFPFEPYNIQKDYMSKVIQCLDEKKNGLLESPTGTGKTLSLICSSLAWLTAKKLERNLKIINEKSNDNFDQSPENEKIFGNSGIPKIFYTSRTHSQLSQVIKEFKSTSYKNVRSSVLGSRDHMCINPLVKDLDSSLSKRYMCESLIKSKSCVFYHNVELKKNNPILTEEVLDIEDLVTAGKKLKCCPYYTAKELCGKADIIFMPYNYIVEKQSRKKEFISLRKKEFISLRNNVVIFDEAHNIDKVCEESASTMLSSTDIAMCIEECTAAMKRIEDDLTGESLAHMEFSPENLVEVKQILLDLEEVIVNLACSKEGETYEAQKIMTIFEEAKINNINMPRLIDIINRIGLFLCSDSSSPFSRNGANLNKFENFLSVINNTLIRQKEKSLKCYRVFIENLQEQNKANVRLDSWMNLTESIKKKKNGKIVNYWCFSPSFGVQQLASNDVYCFILTSGTLAPLPPLISELGIPFPITLENPHIIENNQILATILTNGPDKTELNSSYQNRNNAKYIFSLGVSLTNLARIIPHGMLIFFPSYSVMNTLIDNWKTSGIYDNLNSMKKIFMEGRGHNFTTTINEFYERINDENFKGACFMAVLRGKVSEGLDFTDKFGRAVCIIGIPYPPIKDPKVQLKQKYLDESKAHGDSIISGREWYQLEATRAVNQAIGRVIRHSKDFGAIILCDKRFSYDSVKNNLSKWLRNQIHLDQSFGPLVRNLRQFYHFTETKLPTPVKKIHITEIKKEIKEEIPSLTGGLSDLNEFYSQPSSSYKPQNKKIGLFDFSTKEIQDMKSPPSHNFFSSFPSVKKNEESTNFQAKKRKFNVLPLKSYTNDDD